MKATNLFFSMLAVCVLTFAGCKKSDQQDWPQQFHGINVDWPKLETEFAKASQELRDGLTSVKRFLRYGQFPQALMELDKLSNDSNLTEPQKKLVNDLIQQVKQAIIKTHHHPVSEVRDGIVAVPSVELHSAEPLGRVDQ